MKISMLAGILIVFITASPLANANPVTLSTYLKDPVWAKRFDAIFGQVAKPDWLKDATESEAVSVDMDSKPYTVLLACKKHDCANHQIAVLFDGQAIHGLRFETTDNSIKEELIWLNIGNGMETTDSKTILYAAITGSLFNHLKAFNFPAKK